MAYHDLDGLSSGHTTSGAPGLTLTADGAERLELPDASYVRDAAILRDGADMILDGPQGSITIENYFTGDTPPTLSAPDGSALSPALVNAFVRSPTQYAQTQTLNDESPVGEVAEFKGEATVTHTDGRVETITQGTHIYQGDVIETSADSAVNIHFIDDTSFAVSQDSRLSIDEYVYDSATQSGENNFSILKGMFVFTSGLIGRDDPDDVHINTPTGSIGIRGTIIAGNANSGEVTVIEGAIVVRDLSGNEVTLANQFETARLTPGGGVENIGQRSAQDVSDTFSSIAEVSPTLFSTINDAAGEQNPEPPAGEEAAPAEDAPADANGSVDQNGDNQVDGTVDAPAEDAAPPAPAVPAGDINGGLGLDPMGGETLGTNTPPSTNAGVSPDGLGLANPVGLAPPPPAGALPPPPGQGANAPLPPPPPGGVAPPPPPDPSTLPGGGGNTAINFAPIHIMSNSQSALIDGVLYSAAQIRAESNIAPDAYFFSLYEHQFDDTGDWIYDFSEEFVDPNDSYGVTQITYELSSATITALNAQFSGVGGSWTFDNNTGELSLHVSQTSVVPFTTFSVDIRATDPGGRSSPFGSYDFNLYDAPAAMPGSITTNDGVYRDGSNINNLTVGTSTVVTGNTVFMGAENDTLILYKSANSIFHMGPGSNEISIDNTTGNINNVIIGGDETDKYTIGKAQNKFFGMDGDDVVKLDLSSGGIISNQFITGGDTRIQIDAGASGFKAGVNLANNTALIANGLNYEFGGDASGYGDTLKLTGASGSIDFSAIDNHYFRGFERIDMIGGVVNLTLNYQDVLEMTDYKNTLIFRADSGDTLNFTGSEFSGFTKVGDDISMDDNYDGSGSATSNFDVYTDGTITLLIEDNGAAVTGLPT